LSALAAPVGAAHASVAPLDLINAVFAWGGVDGWRAYVPLGVAGIIVWSLWIYRWILSRAYRPVVNGYATTTSVVVPSFREDVAILRRCLASWLSQNPSELIVVPDVHDVDCIAMLEQVQDPRLRVIPYRHQGKRSALGVGIRAARGEVLVLTDSDTAWEPGLLSAVQMPFENPRVGAVATQQKVYKRWSSVWRLVADWIIDLRYYDYVPAMSRAGGVICVSGRTAAYRRSAVMPVLSNLEHEFFFGRRCVAGDDGRLTWLVLASGYTTVFQSTACAMSMFPSTFAAFVKQRVRWSRNSYRCYLTALWQGWLRQVPFVSKVTVLQILLTPVTMGMALIYLALSRTEPGWNGVLFAATWLMAGRLVRSVSHLWRHPGDIILLPLVTLVVIMISLPIKLYAFLTMNRQGWLTRHEDQTGGEGQSAASLGDPFVDSRAGLEVSDAV
jgi:cellulose synthase/poly-beta-1,6-N-acetylglucosamine synthase-like glycosyltransferase